MERFTTDTPNNNTEAMLNYAYAKDKRAVLRYADGEEGIDLCEYVSRLAKEKGCDHTPEDVMEWACLECDCEIAVLYTVAVQAAELRQRLKAYEDTGLTPEEITKQISADPVHAAGGAYCRECIRLRRNETTGEILCLMAALVGIQAHEDGFCSYGERKKIHNGPKK